VEQSRTAIRDRCGSLPGRATSGSRTRRVFTPAPPLYRPPDARSADGWSSPRAATTAGLTARSLSPRAAPRPHDRVGDKGIVRLRPSPRRGAPRVRTCAARHLRSRLLGDASERAATKTTDCPNRPKRERSSRRLRLSHSPGQTDVRRVPAQVGGQSSARGSCAIRSCIRPGIALPRPVRPTSALYTHADRQRVNLKRSGPARHRTISATGHRPSLRSRRPSARRRHVIDAKSERCRRLAHTAARTGRNRSPACGVLRRRSSRSAQGLASARRGALDRALGADEHH
jgi:hypothetical protein